MVLKFITAVLSVINKIFHVFVIICSLLIFSAAGTLGEGSNESFFTIQIAAFLTEQNAITLQNRMIQKGFSAYINKSLKKNGEEIYAVRIGKFKTKKEAEAYGQYFHQKEKMAYLVISQKMTAMDKTPEKAPNPEAKMEPQKDISLDSSVTVQQESGSGMDEAKKEIHAKDDREWPQGISKIYTYQGPEEGLYITNNPENIPEKYKDKLERLCIFPVKFIAFNLDQEILYLQMDEEEQPVKLIGVDISSPTVAKNAETYFKKNLRDLPLRFEYSLGDNDSKDKVLVGDISFKHGESVNLDMIRQGIAPCYLEGIPTGKRKAFIDAEETARKGNLGIWAFQGRH